MRLDTTVARELVQWLCLRADQAGLSSAQVDSAPNFESVYILTDPTGTVPYYVGQSQMVRKRLLAHMTDPKKLEAGWEGDVRYFVPGIPSTDMRLEVESHLVLALRPPLNQALLLNVRGRRIVEIRYKRKRAA